MNPHVNLKNFGAAGGEMSSTGLVGPPRRLISRVLLPVGLLAGFLGVGLFAARNAIVPAVEVSVVMPVVIGPAGEQQAAESSASVAGAIVKSKLFEAPGWVEPSPYPVLISALTEGTVESMEVLEGQRVTSGSVVAGLVDDDALLAVEQAEAELDLKKAHYQAALENWKNPVSLTESRQTALAEQSRLEAEKARLEDELKLADIEAQVGNSLKNSGYEASLEALRKETRRSMSRNALAETRAKIALNSSTLHAASEHLRLRTEDQKAVAVAEAEMLASQSRLREARLRLERCSIKAPMDGVIMVLHARPGAMLSPEMDGGMQVATMYDPRRLQVRVDVPLAEATAVREGMEVEIKSDALPDVVLKGKLSGIVPEANVQKNVLPVKVQIVDPPESLKPEMIAQVAFFGEGVGEGERAAADSGTRTRPGDLLALPKSAIIDAGSGEAWVLVAAEGHAARKRLRLGGARGDNLQVVLEGLLPTDKVIVDAGAVPEGSRVEVTEVKLVTN